MMCVCFQSWHCDLGSQHPGLARRLQHCILHRWCIFVPIHHHCHGSHKLLGRLRPAGSVQGLGLLLCEVTDPFRGPILLAEVRLKRPAGVLHSNRHSNGAMRMCQPSPRVQVHRSEVSLSPSEVSQELACRLWSIQICLSSAGFSILRGGGGYGAP